MTQTPAETSPASAGAELSAELHLTLGRIADSLDKDERRRRQLNASILPLSIELIPVTASSIVDQPNTLGPRDGWYWDIETVIIQGLTAGQIILYAKTAVVTGTTVTGVQWGVFTVSGQQNWGKKQFTLVSGERMILQGNASVPAGAFVSIYGTQVAQPLWGDYAI